MNINPIDIAVRHWVETGEVDGDLLQRASEFVEQNPLTKDRQDVRILHEIKEGAIRQGDGETQRLLRIRENFLANPQGNSNITQSRPQDHKRLNGEIEVLDIFSTK